MKSNASMSTFARIRSNYTFKSKHVDDGPMKPSVHFLVGVASSMSEYLSYDGIKTWYKTLADQQPDLVQYSTIGKTHQGHDMFAIHVGNGTEGVTYLQGLVHAREWATGPILAHIVDNIVDSWASSRSLSKMKVVVVPVANPDGYEYSRTVDKLWRKNRAPGKGGIGVDLNRNFPARWSEATDGLFPPSENYRGQAVASELEVQAIMRHLRPMPVKAALDFHGYGKRILYPSARKNPSIKSKRVGEEMASRIKTTGNPFSAMPISSFTPATGSLVEWAHTQKGALSYGIEVPPGLSEQPNVTIGFFPDPSILQSQAKDLMPAIHHLVASSSQKYQV
ncbi:hypothetical protein DSO57_1017593 [Entomophthora muscae]|uniref:Uncharacterized protein n=1 Tax=Entomophthora muscae TaxID=34485 RepID=A0ACC2UPX6_9FUNG|nr:hypothetical protein DSO57_1017593 [Entomophthora muscae]